MIKAVIFDADGTLFNSFDFIVSAYQYIATEHGFPAPSAADVRGQLSIAAPISTIMQTFFPGVPVDDLLASNGQHLANNPTGYTAFDGLHTMLDLLQGQGISMGILTGGNHKIHDVLQHHGIAGYFGSVVHQDRVQRSKPDPEGFMLCADELSVLPSETIMVGDSPSDIFAGKNAGAALTIGLTHGNATREALQAADPDYIVDSLAACLTCIKSKILV